MDAGNGFLYPPEKDTSVTLGLKLCISVFILTFLYAKIETLLVTLFQFLVVAVFSVALALLLAQFVQRLLRKGWGFVKGFAWRKASEIFVNMVVKPIRESLAYGLDIASFALTEVERNVYNVCSFLWDIFQRGIEKIRFLFPDESAPSEQDVYTKQISKKAVLLISLPYSRSYNVIKAEITVDLPKPVFINWQGNKKSDIPPLIELKTSVRHFALCIIPLEAWDDPTKSLMQKFAYGNFWELVGPEPRPREGECVSWKSDQVERIDAMLEVGVTPCSNDYVSGQFYRHLRHAWGNYEVVWWNSFDFAIRLAYLLKYSIPTSEKLMDFRRAIEKRRAWEVMKTRERALSNRTLMGGHAFGVGCFVSALVPPVGVAFAVGSWGFTAVSFLQGAYEAMREEPSYMAEWRRKSTALEREVPQLRGFMDN